MLSKEQIGQIKKQVIQQIESTFPEDKKDQAKAQIEAMNSEEFEKFLEQNKLIKNKDVQSTQRQQCIFCLINSGQINSYKLDENKNSAAILEINPISKAHTIIIPKEHLQNKKIPKEIYSLAERISKKIRTKFKPKGMIFSEDDLFGHKIVNVIPIYKNETINSNRYQAKKEDLEKIQKALAKKPGKETKREVKKVKNNGVVKKSKKPKTTSETKLWLPKRIP